MALMVACAGWAQFKTTAPLVIAPTTVTDSKGHYVDGLTPADLILYDNSVPQAVQMDWTAYPISLVVGVQTSSNAGAVLDKLGGAGILLTQLLAADRGETAVLSFSDRVKVHQPFTSEPEPVIHALRMLRKEGDGARTLDAIEQALVLLEHRPQVRRRVILVIGEKRDRGSEAKLPEVVARVQRLNAAVDWLTYSPFLEPFTVKAKTAEDLKPEDERIKVQQCAVCPAPDDTPAPPDVGPGGYIYAIGELFRLRRPDLSQLFTTTTGGRTLSFLKKNALEQAIQLVGEEVHRQYVLSFEPKGVAPGGTGGLLECGITHRSEKRVCPFLFGGAGLGVPAGGVAELLEVCGGDERHRQILGVADFGHHDQPIVAVGRLDAIVVFGEGGIGAVRNAVFAKIAGEHVGGGDFEITARFPLGDGVALPGGFARRGRRGGEVE